MLNWLAENYLVIIAMGVLAICLVAMALLPSRKKMMLGQAKSVSSAKISFAYGAASASFGFILLLVIFLLLKPDMFKELIATVFLYSNIFLCLGVGIVLFADAHWVNNFSQELAPQPDTTDSAVVQVVEAPAMHIQCPMCHQEIIVPHEMLGHVIACPSCGVEGRIGGGGAAQ